MTCTAQTQKTAWPLSADFQIELNTVCYPLEVIYRTCYAFTDRAYLWLEPGQNECVIVALTHKDASRGGDSLAGEFANALIDFGLRRQIAIESADVRKALVHTALVGLTR